MRFCHMRIARPVTDLIQSSKMYCSGLGLENIAEFTNHQGFSGVMLGRSDLDWHLEFTVCHEHPIAPAPSPDDLLILYVPDRHQWEKSCDDMVHAGFSRVASFNPYWDVAGSTFVDRDGYRTVIQNRAWPP